MFVCDDWASPGLLDVGEWTTTLDEVCDARSVRKQPAQVVVVILGRHGDLGLLCP